MKGKKGKLDEPDDNWSGEHSGCGGVFSKVNSAERGYCVGSGGESSTKARGTNCVTSTSTSSVSGGQRSPVREEERTSGVRTGKGLRC